MEEENPENLPEKLPEKLSEKPPLSRRLLTRISNYVKSNSLFLAALMILLAFIVYKRLPLYLEKREMTGKQAPPFELVDLQGKKVRLSDYKGKAILLDFWATWCMPCRVEVPILNSIYDELKDKNFVILGIAVDDPEAVKKFVKKTPVKYPVLLEVDGKTADDYKIRVFPTLYLVNPEGEIVDVSHGLDFFLKWKIRLRVTGNLF